jgi:hypothetical protein
VTSIVAVDLAAKYSAACWMRQPDQVLCQWDSWHCLDETTFIDHITLPFAGYGLKPDVMVVEDLPHRLPFMALVKQVCRIQGRIVERMDNFHCGDRVLFAPPAEWRKAYKGLERGTGPDVVVPVAAEFGYAPPDLSHFASVHKGGRAIARKVATDYCAAYLIGRWALSNMAVHGTYDVLGTSRYSTPPVRKEQ